MAKESKKSTSKKITKPKSSLRERNIKAAKDKQKPKRVRKAAVSVVKPLSKVSGALRRNTMRYPRKMLQDSLHVAGD